MGEEEVGWNGGGVRRAGENFPNVRSARNATGITGGPIGREGRSERGRKWVIGASQ